jgi:flagellar biosynthesis GTPase FlhF
VERFTSTSYESAMKLAKTKFKNGFEVSNTREINLSNSGLSNDKLVEITVTPIKNIPEIIEVKENILNLNNELIPLIKNELSPIKDLHMEISLLRQEIDLLSRKVNKLIQPELNENEQELFDSLSEIGFENPMALKFTRELSALKGNQFNLKNISNSFIHIFSKYISPLSIKNGDAIVLFGQTKSGKSKTSELIADELLNIGSVHIRKEININEKIKDGITIIDSPPIRLNEMGAMQNLSKLADSFKQIHRILVLSASTGFDEMLHLIASFAPIKPNFIIFTKFDETIMLGKLLTVLNESGLKVCGITTYSDGEIEFSTQSQNHFINSISKQLGLN